MNKLYRTELFYIRKSHFWVAAVAFAALLLGIECMQNDTVATLTSQSQLREISFDTHADALISKRMFDLFSNRSSIFLFTTFLSCGIIAYSYDCKQLHMYVQRGFPLALVIIMKASLVLICVIFYTMISSTCFFLFYSWYWNSAQLSRFLHAAILRFFTATILASALIIVTVVFKSLIKSAVASLLLLLCSYRCLFSRISSILGIILDLNSVQAPVWEYVIVLCMELLIINVIIAIHQHFGDLQLT